ncbi:MAG: rifamycin-inactivating phosphotransferase, partial [Gemmatimonadaceae bacterium]
FCVAAGAFARIMAAPSIRHPERSEGSIHDRLERLARLKADDHEAIRALSSGVRRSIETTPIPDDVAAAITRSVARLGEEHAYAVRSSATAEDLPTASFAGQHDTYLNVVGPAAILEHISRCWASLFTERAVTYRLHNGFDHGKVHMAVVVQRMVFSQAAGILFTADPVSGNRKLAFVEASFGLGEALVDGLVNADVYEVRGDKVVSKTVGAKQLAVHASPSGGTRERAIEPERQQQPALTEHQVVRLVQLGRRIEAHFGYPQDIEWCLADDDFMIVQSRPITTLFPVPAVSDGENHVYVSVGHQQMMTDPMKPLGLSVWQMTTPRPMAEAGGRLFVDVTQLLASPASRTALLATLGKSDPLIRDALQTILDRGDFVRSLPDEGPAWAPPGAGSAAIETDPDIVTDLIERSQASLAMLKHDVRQQSGSALLDFITADQERKRIQFDPRSLQVIMAGMEAAWWLNDHMHTWLGETNAADTLAQSVPNNVTSEMGLELLDVADVIRPHSEVVACLQNVEDEGFLNALDTLAGGRQARDAIRDWLDKYGMRGAGEIDITRPRWSERPTMLVPLILGNIKNFEPGASERRFEQGRQAAWTKEQELLGRLRALPDGARKADETKRMIDRVRTFAGYREYPKYAMVSRYFVYKQALLGEAERLVQAGVLREKEDIFYLRFDELHGAVRTSHVDDQLIRRRKDEFNSYQALTPPRVLTSDGEGIAGAYRRDDLLPGALIGLPVSAGTIEGRARVIVDMAEADLEPGDILVTAYTEPSWTPLFVAIKGLVELTASVSRGRAGGGCPARVDGCGQVARAGAGDCGARRARRRPGRPARVRAGDARRERAGAHAPSTRARAHARAAR